MVPSVAGEGAVGRTGPAGLRNVTVPSVGGCCFGVPDDPPGLIARICTVPGPFASGAEGDAGAEGETGAAGDAEDVGPGEGVEGVVGEEAGVSPEADALATRGSAALAAPCCSGPPHEIR